MSSTGKRPAHAPAGKAPRPTKGQKTVPQHAEAAADTDDDDMEVVNRAILGDDLYDVCDEHFEDSDWDYYKPANLPESYGEFDDEILEEYPLAEPLNEAMIAWAKDILEQKGVDENGDEIEEDAAEEEEGEEEEEEEEGEEEEGEEDDEESYVAGENAEAAARMAVEGGPANAAEAAAAGLPAPVPDTSNDEQVAAAVAEGEEEDDGKRGTVTRLRRQLDAQKAQTVKSNNECARLKEANATLVHALRQNQIPVPEGANMVAGVSGSLTIVADQLVPMTGIAPPPADSAVGEGEMPFIMRMCNLPKTDGIVAAKRFPLSQDRWPHILENYKRSRATLAPHVEKRAKQYLKFGLFDKRDAKRVVTEKDLLPGESNREMVGFKLMLIYDDTEEEVTLESLCEVRAKTIATLSKPDIINKGIEAMRNGSVSFLINNQHVLSSLTKPKHRKFRWKIVCTHPTFKDVPEMSAESPGFYCVARSKTPQLERKNGPAGSEAAASTST